MVIVMAMGFMHDLLWLLLIKGYGKGISTCLFEMHAWLWLSLSKVMWVVLFEMHALVMGFPLWKARY